MGRKSLSTAVPVPAQEHLMVCESNIQIQFEAHLTSRSELRWSLSCQTRAQLMPGVRAKLNTECRKALNAPNSGQSHSSMRHLCKGHLKTAEDSEHCSPSPNMTGLDGASSSPKRNGCNSAKAMLIFTKHSSVSSFTITFPHTHHSSLSEVYDSSPSNAAVVQICLCVFYFFWNLVHATLTSQNAAQYS